MSVPIVTIGFFGGSAPSIIKAAAALAAGTDLFSLSWGFWVGAALYGLIGGVVALALGEQNLRGALFAGIAAPALVSNAITGAQNERPPSGRPPVVIHEAPFSPASGAPAPKPGSFLFGMPTSIAIHFLVSTAQAQQHPAPPSPNVPSAAPIAGATPTVAASGTMDVRVRFQTIAPGQTPVRLCLIDPSQPGSCAWSATVSSSTDVTSLPVQPGAALVVNGTTVPVNPESTGISVDVRSASSPVADFRWALGGRREAGRTQITVAPIAPSQLR